MALVAIEEAERKLAELALEQGNDDEDNDIPDKADCRSQGTRSVCSHGSTFSQSEIKKRLVMVYL